MRSCLAPGLLQHEQAEESSPTSRQSSLPATFLRTTSPGRRRARPTPSWNVSCSGLDPWTISDPSRVGHAPHLLDGAGDRLELPTTAKAASSDGETASTRTTVKVSALPDYLPPIELSVPAAGTLAPGWTLINLSNAHTNVPYIAALVDPKGRYRWYYQYPGRRPRLRHSGVPVQGRRRHWRARPAHLLRHLAGRAGLGEPSQLLLRPRAPARGDSRQAVHARRSRLLIAPERRRTDRRVRTSPP